MGITRTTRSRRQTLTALSLTVATALLATACGGPVTGVVVDRQHERGDWERKCTSKTTSTGKSKRTCKRTWDDPAWSITIRTPDGDTIERDVSQAVYDASPVGKTVTID